MRIWDIPPEKLCRNHLLGEHRELHAIWVILTHHKKGYYYHPETMRWKGKLAALYNRHELLVTEMQHRGYQHKSPLDSRLATGKKHQTMLLDSVETQYSILRSKKCSCKL